MATATRAVAIRRPTRTIVVRSKSRGRGKFRLPLAVVAGFIPMAQGIYAGSKPGGPAGGGINGAMWNAQYLMLGRNADTNKFEMRGLVMGWGPVLAGVLAHTLANRFGINRLIARTKLPIAI